jgi:hypothetical protein
MIGQIGPVDLPISGDRGPLNSVSCSGNRSGVSESHEPTRACAGGAHQLSDGLGDRMVLRFL